MLQRRTFLQLMTLLFTFLPQIESEPTTEIPVETPPTIIEPSEEERIVVKLHIGDKTFNLSNLDVDFDQDIQPIDYGTRWTTYEPGFKTAKLNCVSVIPLTTEEQEYIMNNIDEIVLENVSGRGYFDWYAFDMPRSAYFLDSKQFVIINNGYGRIL